MAILLYYAIIILVCMLDLFTKELVLGSETLLSGGTIDIIPGVLRLNYTTNRGAAMGMLSDSRWVFMILSVVAIAGLITYITIRRKKIDLKLGIAFSMIIGGGIGNMVERFFNGDRIGDGAVTDFIDFCAFPDLWYWTFNVADAFVCVGAALFILFYILDEIKESKTRKALIKEYGEDCEEALSEIEENEEDISDLAFLDGVFENDVLENEEKADNNDSTEKNEDNEDER